MTDLITDINYTVIGNADDLRNFLCGPPQHDEHTKGWRWHQYCADDEKRWDAVEAELVKIREERHAFLASLRAKTLEAELAELTLLGQ